MYTCVFIDKYTEINLSILMFFLHFLERFIAPCKFDQVS